MTTTPSGTATRSDVAAFVADVRGRLGDLTADERDDLLDGLDADLADQLADGAGELPDPATYAAELRAAAGLAASPVRRPRLPRVSRLSAGSVGRVLDRTRTRWLAVVERRVWTARAWEVAVVLQPAWWALRAWVAVTMLDQDAGDPEPITLVPSLATPGLGLAVLVLAVLGSVLVGRGLLWPGGGRARRGATRLVLGGLNVVAVVGLVSLVQHSADTRLEAATAAATSVDGAGGPGTSGDPVPRRGIAVDERSVHNLYPYDAEGRPLVGVQLFDDAGRPVSLPQEQATTTDPDGHGRVVGCPWLNGTQRLYNVFPLPERTQRQREGCVARLDGVLGTGTLPTPPLAQAPPVSLPTAAPAP